MPAVRERPQLLWKQCRVVRQCAQSAAATKTLWERGSFREARPQRPPSSVHLSASVYNVKSSPISGSLSHNNLHAPLLVMGKHLKRRREENEAPLAHSRHFTFNIEHTTTEITHSLTTSPSLSAYAYCLRFNVLDQLDVVEHFVIEVVEPAIRVELESEGEWDSRLLCCRCWRCIDVSGRLTCRHQLRDAPTTLGPSSA